MLFYPSICLITFCTFQYFFCTTKTSGIANISNSSLYNIFSVSFSFFPHFSPTPLSTHFSAPFSHERFDVFPSGSPVSTPNGTKSRKISHYGCHIQSKLVFLPRRTKITHSPQMSMRTSQRTLGRSVWTRGSWSAIGRGIDITCRASVCICFLLFSFSVFSRLIRYIAFFLFPTAMSIYGRHSCART